MIDFPKEGILHVALHRDIVSETPNLSCFSNLLTGCKYFVLVAKDPSEV